MSGIHPVDLYAQTLSELISRTQVDPAIIEDVITGCVIQVAEQSGNIGRQAALAAGFPESVPAITLDRKCGSAQQAMDFAAQGVISGAYDTVIAGGVEMMSTVPMRINRMGKDNEGELFRSRYPDGMIRQGVSAELIASRWNIAREELDQFSMRSHIRAADDVSGRVKDIVSINKGLAEDGVALVCDDEGVRPNTNLETLSNLDTVFKTDEMSARYPEINWSLTAASSSPVSDGASALLIMEEQLAMRLNLTPRAAIT
ncbi:MAG: acetyl-CoA C-acyltransferase, partial [Thiotrichales bacterium]